MKQYIMSVFLALVVSGITYAQNDMSTKEDADKFYGKGGKKETKTITLSDGTKEETVRFIDPGKRVRQYKKTTTKKDGSSIEEHVTYDCNGKKTDSEYIMKDANGDVEYYRAERYSDGPNNEVIEGYLSEKNAKGEIDISTFNPKTGKYEKAAKSDPQPTKPTFEQNRSTCPLPEYKIELFFGYSYLHANFDPENEGLSGWAASAFYKFSPRWSAGLFASGHYKSPENQKFSMYFLHAALKYDFLNNERRENRFNPYISLGLGISTYKSEVNIPGITKFTTDDNSITGKIGAGVDWELVKKMALKADVSYVPTHFNDQTQHNVRLSAGLAVGLFRARREFAGGD